MGPGARALVGPSHLGGRLRRVVSAVVAGLVLGVGTVGSAAAVEFRTTEPDRTHSWVPNGRVLALLVTADAVYVGGTFTRVRNPVTGQSAVRNRLAAFDRATGALLPWDPGASDNVRALAAGPDGTVYAGGLFTQAAGAPNAWLAAITPQGTSVPGFAAALNHEVRDISFTAAGLHVAGRFATVDGVGRVGVARLDPATGRLDRSFNARLGQGRAWTLSDSGDGRLVLGGNFQTVAGATHRWLAVVDPFTGALAGAVPPEICGSCQLLDTVVADGDIYAAAAGSGGGRVASWSLDDLDRRWVRLADGDVQSVDVHDGVVYAGGHFGPTFFGATRHQLALLTLDGELLPGTIPFTGRDQPGLWAVDAADDFLRIGGGFQGVAGSDVARYAAFPADQGAQISGATSGQVLIRR